jgi:trans-aconitate methyltransferase
MLLSTCAEKTILDIGCAEGLIAMELARRGARHVHGIEIVPGHLKVAHALRGDLACTFEHADANTYLPRAEYDIILMLAILHKLKDPSAACRRIAGYALGGVVIRLPPEHAPRIKDARSGFREHDIAGVMHELDFTLAGTFSGHFDEWVGYFLRT